jgi:hypothetical protein
VSTPPEIAPSAASEERNWLPLIVAAAAVLLIAAVAILLTMKGGNAHSTVSITPITAPLDTYAASLSVTRLSMSESANLAGGKVTYVDGFLTNNGPRTVTAATVQVLFRDFSREVTQNQTLPLRLIRVREPAVDLESVSAAPLKPGDEKEFRLIFDSVKPDWDGAYPEIRILHVETK